MTKVTPETILQASETELPKILGEVLNNVAAKHKWLRGECECGANMNLDKPIYHDCTRVTPVALTPDNQVKYRDRAVEKWGILTFIRALRVVMCDNGEQILTAILCKAKPKHYLQAAAICEVEER